MLEDHLYARLGVSENATQQEIKRAYHSLLLKVKANLKFWLIADVSL